MNNLEILQKIPTEKKLEMIADGNTLSAQDMSEYGVPQVKKLSLSEVNKQSGGIYPDYFSLAASWNTSLLSSVTGDLTLRARILGANLVETPDMRVLTTPYKSGFSEDPLLNSVFLYDLATTIKKAGAAPFVVGCEVDGADIEYLDTEPDKRTLCDLFFSPFICLGGLEGGAVSAVSYTTLAGSYSKVNYEVLGGFLQSAIGNNGYIVSRETQKDLTVECVMADNTLTFGGDISRLKAALNEYDGIKRAIETGEATAEDLDYACRTGSAISHAAVDEAADKIIDFATFCAESSNVPPVQPFNSAELSLKAAEESIVLLKNEGNILPLSAMHSVAVIGQSALQINPATKSNFVQILTGLAKIKVVGTAAGYKGSERDDTLISEACSVAKSADTVIVFLHLDEPIEATLKLSGKAKLPANMLALLHSLKSVNRRIIAVLSTSLSIDMSFDENVSALLLSPLNGARSFEALVKIISGKACPSGRLTRTLYSGTDDIFSKLKADISSGRIKCGPFTGYRRYDTEGTPVKYPFGFGLSYTTFKYISMTVRTGEYADVTIKNTGKYAGSEVVQFYAGKPSSNVVRPFKELKSFVKVFLKAGETKTVRLRIQPALFGVYCDDCGKRLVEAGEYRLYAGSSVSDIKLQTTITVSGTALKPDGEKLSSYLTAKSNVTERGYALTPVKVVKGNVDLLKCISFVLLTFAVIGTITLILLSALKVATVSNSVPAALVLTAVLLLYLSGFGLLGYCIYKNYQAKQSAHTVDPAPADEISKTSTPIEKLFEEQFKPDERQQQEEEDGDDEQTEILKYLDPALTFQKLCESFSEFLEGQGLGINSQDTIKLFSAMSASRLIVLKSERAQQFIFALSAFFGSEAYISDQPDAIAALGEQIATDAAGSKHTVHFAAFENINISELGAKFSAFAKYLKNPDGAAKYTSPEKQFSLPPNMWLLATLSDESLLAAADTFADNICILDIDITEANGAPCAALKPSYYQLNNMFRTALKNKLLDEDKCWKKIDRLEEFIAKHAEYSIGNRQCQRLEGYSSVYLACGGLDTDALDCAVASVLLADAARILDGKLTRKLGSLSSAIENIFGETRECKKILKYSGLTLGNKR